MKLKLIFISAFSTALLLSGCSADRQAASPSQALPAQTTASAVQSSVEINGSVSALPLMRALSQGAFDLNGTQCDLTASGKKSSLASLTDGTSDLILFEGDSSDIPDGATGAPVAFEAVAVIANLSCGVKDLSAAQLTAIFSGEQTSWSSLGGSGEVTLVVPEADDSFRQTFEELFSLRASVNGIMKSVIPSSAVISSQVEQDVAATPGAIGIWPASLLESNDTVVSIGGAAPTSEALKNGTYPAARTMVLVLRQGASEAAGDFYTYCTSQAAANVISASGYIPY